MLVKVNIPTPLLQKLDERAKRTRRSRASLIRQYIDAQFRDGREDPQPQDTHD